ncbi:hypothetical protein CPB85DRAFT_1251286 [Mucidula mucida]|nr:hypothetical protein CPB85DRAFT_1251286 [Mucidula mucida]
MISIELVVRVVSLIFEIVKSLCILILWVIDPSLVPPLPTHRARAPDSAHIETVVADDSVRRKKKHRKGTPVASIESLKKRLRRIRAFASSSSYTSSRVYYIPGVLNIQVARKGHITSQTFNVARLPSTAPEQLADTKAGEKLKKKTLRKKILRVCQRVFA